MMLERLPISFLIILPMLGALLCLGPWFARERDTNGRLCRAWALFVSVLTLGLLLALAKGIISSPDTANALHESRSWIPSLGITFSLTLDGLSLVFALLTCVVSLSVIGWLSKPSASGAGWYALLLFGEASVLGAFLATDLVLFYCLYELMLLPVLGAMALWGGPRRIQAALKFLLYTVAGSVPMFLAILYLVWQGQGYGYGLNGVGELSSTEQLTLGAAFLLAFAVKIPIVPLHGWLPDTYREAPYGIAAFTAALLGKVGIYAVVRFMFPLFPDFMHSAGPFLAAFGAVGVVYGALIAAVQRDIPSLLAYSSISHLGFCVLGLASTNELALTGVVFQALSHGLVTAALFLVFGAVIDREGVRDFDGFGGLATKMPRAALFLMVFSIAAVALPLTSSFVGEFLIILGSWGSYPGWTALSLVGVVLGAVYTLTAYLKTMFGPAREHSVARQGDISSQDLIIMGALALAIIALGVFPNRMLSFIAPVVNAQVTRTVALDKAPDSDTDRARFKERSVGTI